MLNEVKIIGNMTDEPTIEETKGGTVVAKFSVAHNYGKQDDQKTDFFDVQAYGKIAEIVRDNFSKGDTLLVTGEIHINRQPTEIVLETGETKDVQRQFTSINAATVFKLDKAKKK